MKPLYVLPILLLAGCSANQSTSVAPSSAPQAVSVVATTAPPPAASAPVSSSPGTTSGATVLGAHVEPTSDPNAPSLPPPDLAPAPPKSDFLVPDVTADGGVKGYADEMVSRVDAANSSDELMKIRGDIANNALFFDKASRDAGDAGNSNERILNQLISALCDSLSSYARNKSSLMDGSLPENYYEQVKGNQQIEISHNAFMADSFFAAHRK